MLSNRIYIFTAGSLLLSAAACAADTSPAEDVDSSSLSAESPSKPSITFVGSSAATHMMPLKTSSSVVANSCPAGAHLTNFGGPTLRNVHVTPLFWNSSTQFQSNLNAFYNDVPNSPLYTMLSQYGIGHGNGQAGFLDNQAGGSFSDAQVQQEVFNQLAAGHLPLPNANTYYPVHFPPGTSITAADGSQSCVQFCAYHSTFQVSVGGVITNVNYGVIPDQGGGCAGGCGGNPSRVNNLDSVSSHELVEATTDPAVGLATTFGPPLGWNDPNNGEIGDICNAQQGTTTGNGHSYVIQLEWSNAANCCVQQ